jgi:hypothetical protein
MKVGIIRSVRRSSESQRSERDEGGNHFEAFEGLPKVSALKEMKVGIISKRAKNGAMQEITVGIK